MSIVSEIERIKTNIANAYTACEEKGATMPDTLNSSNLVDCIASITGGGNSKPTDGYVTNGLLINLSGIESPISTMWIDSVNRLNATLYKTPTYDSESKSYSFNGSTQYARFDLEDDATDADWTIEAYYKQDTASPLDIMFGAVTGQAGGGFLNNNGTHYCWVGSAKGSVYTLPTADRPEQIAGKKVYTRISRKDAEIYFDLKDDERSIAKNYTAFSGSTGMSSDFAICRNGSANDTRFSKAQIYAIRVYNRKLTDEEIQQNYEQDVRNFGE